MEVINFHPTPPTSCCVVCGTSSPSSNYVDLTLVSSRTSQSDTPVRDKVRTIIGEEKWMMPQQQRGDLTMVMCHQCFHLVDQFDALEAQLHSVKAQLCDKYFAFHGSPPVVVDHQVPYQRLDHHRVQQHGHNNGGGGQQRVKRGTVAATTKNRAQQGNVSGKRKRGGTVLETREQNLSLQTTQHGVCLQVDNRKDKTEAILQWHNTVLHPFEQTAGPGLPELAVPSQQLTDRETEHIITSLNNAVADSAWRPPAQQSPCLQQQRQTVHHHDPVSEDEAQDSAQRPAEEVVYDHLPGLLVPGERLRVGTLLLDDGGPSYRCCYCGDLFAERIVLSSHVHSHHRPEVLTAQVPAELGLGSKLNCGVQLSNVTATSSEFAKPFACIFCDSAFKFKSNVHLHFKEKHTPYKPFSCMDCSETFRRSMELSRHRVYYCSFRKKGRAGGDKKSK